MHCLFVGAGAIAGEYAAGLATSSLSLAGVCDTVAERAFTLVQILLWYVVNSVNGSKSIPADVGTLGAVEKSALPPDPLALPPVPFFCQYVGTPSFFYRALPVNSTDITAVQAGTLGGTVDHEQADFAESC